MADEVELYRQRKEASRVQGRIDTAFEVAEEGQQPQSEADVYIVRKREQQRQAAVQAAARVENAGSPDEYVADTELARDYQTLVNPDVTPPPSFVAQNRDRLSAAIQRQRTTTALSSSPMLTRWLNDEQNAALAADDVPALAGVEEGLGYAKNALKRGTVDRYTQVGNQFAADTVRERIPLYGKSFSDLYREARGPRYGHGFFGTSPEIEAHNADVMRRLEEAKAADAPMEERMAIIGEMRHDGETPNNAFFTALGGSIELFIQETILGRTQEEQIERATGYQQAAAAAAQAAAETPFSPAAQRAMDALKDEEPLSLSEATSRVLDLATSDPGALAAMVAEVGIESSGSLIPSAAVTVATRSPGAGAATMGALSYTVERNLEPVKFFSERGYDLTKPEDVQRAFANPELMQEAADRGHTRGLIIGALDLVSGGIAGKALAKNPVADAALQSMVQGALGGTGEGLAQYATDGEVDYGEVVIEALAEFSTAPIDVAAVGARTLGDRKARAAEAAERAETVQQLGGAAAESKLRERAPEKFRQFIESSTQGSDVETMYFPAEEFLGYFQSQNISPEQIAEVLPGVDIEQVRRAAVTGEDITMPTATYMERVAGSDMDQFVMDNAKFSPSDMTPAEARTFEDNAQLEEARVAAQQEAFQAAQAAEASAAETVYVDVVDQLVEAGRSRVAAQQEAQLYPAFYTALAERLGTTVEALAGTYKPPKVEGPQVEQLRGVKVDALTRDIAGMRERIRVRSLGGSLAAGAEAATPENEYLDAVEQSVRAAGLDPNTATEDDIRAAVAPETIELNQSVADVTQTPAFREWAGTPDPVIEPEEAADFDFSKEGTHVLRVFHGTTHEFSEFDASVKGTKEGQFGAVNYFTTSETDVNANYAGRGPDLTGRIENRYEQLFDDIDRRVQEQEDLGVTDPEEAFANIVADLSDVYEFDSGAVDDMFVDGDPDEGIDVEALARYIAETTLDGGDPKVMELFVRTEKPFVVGGEDVWATLTDVEAIEAEALERVADEAGVTVEDVKADPDAFEDEMQDARWDVESETPNKLTEAIEEVAGRYDLDPAEVLSSLYEVTADGEVTHTALEDALRSAEAIQYAEDPEDGSLVGFQVLAEIVQELGYDSIILKNADQRFSNMEMDPGSVHVHVFDENNTHIKSATDNEGTFDPNDANIYKQSALDDVDLEALIAEVEVLQEKRQAADDARVAAQLESPEFKEWFGDSAVTADGEPQVVYHGTPTAQFEAFNTEGANATAGTGAYFSADRNVASTYGTGEIYPVYLSLQNPLVIDAKGANWDAIGEDGTETTNTVAVRAREEGYDGVIIRNVIDRGPHAGEKFFASKREEISDIFVAFNAEQVKAAEGKNSGAFDPNDPSMYKQEERGRIRLPKAGLQNGQAVIELFKQADLSTFLHESGHFFLTVLQDVASQENAPAEVVSMVDDTRSWWKENAAAVAKDGGNGVTEQDVVRYIDAGTTGDATKDAAVDVGMQEQWARAFETYLMEGKAPTASLRAAFEQFRAWLLEVYKKIRGDLNVEVTDDIRQVFDMLLATDAEIANAREDNSGDMLAATAADLGVSEEDYAQLAKLHQEAQDQTAARTIQAAMAPIRRMRDKAFKERRAEIQSEVEAEVNSRPVYRAIEWLGNKRWLGAEEQPKIPTGMRLNKEQLVERYGPGILRTLPRGSFRVYTPGGMDIDEVAGWFGYASGDELVQEMEQAPKREAVVANETDRRAMDELSKDASTASAAEEATAAFHGDKRGDYIAAELRTLYKATGNGNAAKTSTANYARQVAKRTMAGLRARDAVASNRYLAAERKAAEQAQEAFARGDKRAAADFKRRQLFNHMMFVESRRVAEEVGKTERLAKRLNSKGTRKNLAPDYLGAIDDVLEQYDFRKIGPGKEKSRERMLAYVEMMKAAGRENEIAIPPHILESAKAQPYMTLPVENLRGVYTTLRNIESTARRAQKLIDAKNERDMDAVVNDLTDAFGANIKGKPPARVETSGERARRSGRQFMDLVLNADTLLREVDGFQDGDGAAYMHLKSGLDEATARLQVRRKEAAEAFEQLYSVYDTKERNQMAVATYIPELNVSMAKWDLISVVLNMGNADNIQRLTDSKVKGSFTQQQLDAVVARMDKRDMDFVQSVWDYIDSFYDEIAAREKRVTGVAPQKVQAQELQTPHGVYKGGYYPLKYDPRLSDRVAEETTEEIMNNMRAGRFGKAQTRNGHTKERAQSSGRAVLLDIGVLHGHINTVLHDLELSEQVTNTWRILQDPRVKGLFLDNGKQVDHQALEMWVQDVASGQVNSSDVLARTARFLKSGFTVSKLAFNLSTVAVQITGVSQSMVVIGKKNFVKGAAQYAANPLRTSRDVLERSDFMAERETTFNKDIYDIMGDIKVGPKAGLYKRAMQNYIGPASFYLMQKVQFYAVDMPTWLGAYQKALTDTAGDEAASIQLADRAVARAQASGIFSDRSPIERGTLTPTVRQNDFVRLFTALGSYMFAKFNVAYERTGKTDFRSPKEVLSYSIDMVLLFTVEAILYNAIKGTLPGMGDEDDEEWAEFLAKETALSAMGTMPFVRDLASPLQGFSGGGAYGSVMETLTKPFLQAAQGEVDKAFVKSLVDSGGMLLHLPSTQVNRFIDAGWRQSEGEDVAPIEYIMGKR